MYFKDDTHWNNFGAYSAYENVVEALNKQNLKIKKSKYTLKHETEEMGDLAKMLNLELHKIEDIYYPKYDVVKKYDEKTIINEEHNKDKENKDIFTNNKNAKNSYKMLVYRDSFSIKLILFFANDFKSCAFFWTKNARKSEMDEYNIIILETVERTLYRLLDAKLGE